MARFTYHTIYSIATYAFFNVMMIGNNNNNNISKKEQPLIKKPVYDILGYSTSIAVKMTALANPNHMVIGQLVYDVLDDNQKSLFQQLTMSPEIWSYVNTNAGGNIYNIYTNKFCLGFYLNVLIYNWMMKLNQSRPRYLLVSFGLL
jgi:hypothetical protein